MSFLQTPLSGLWAIPQADPPVRILLISLTICPNPYIRSGSNLTFSIKTLQPFSSAQSPIMFFKRMHDFCAPTFLYLYSRIFHHGCGICTSKIVLLRHESYILTILELAVPTIVSGASKCSRLIFKNLKIFEGIGEVLLPNQIL